ncbi:hypothetical protein [Tritonibacter mobilis]|uniref:hypothetical protein n=1 Tax=Tritonibacter mobilis TaxID=379347 RepID=UPI00398FC3E4
MAMIEPFDDEDPLAFVERADTLKVSEEIVTDALKQHFGINEDVEIKKLKLQSKVFWEAFYFDHIRDLFTRDGSRYAAVKFIQRKNDFAEERRKLTEKEIERLVDSVGEWRW